MVGGFDVLDIELPIVRGMVEICPEPCFIQRGRADPEVQRRKGRGFEERRAILLDPVEQRARTQTVTLLQLREAAGWRAVQRLVDKLPPERLRMMDLLDLSTPRSASRSGEA
ncbi:hypothetical protein LZK98_04845 [Sphingomonas cannabina]|uniref:hypothetical protein n=1 Tax=Sphingomonas cannabina TaxID=2899123 RepID=UPI001F45A2DB|nr:hypothetical protein [Sphingomonas cannabina]UIJ46278.1 hypothetical protein LZK98_04845 [Sphingomonas cannabina]